MRTPVGAGGRMAGLRLVAVAGQRQAARPVPGRPDYARVPRDRLPVDLFQQAEARTLGPLPAGARVGVTHDNGTGFARRTPAEAFADELLNLQDKQGCCTSKIDNGLQVFWHYLGQYAGNFDTKSPGKQLAY
ncbi:hypothetical protein BBM1605_03815 [Bifidobacterium breve MCC 1605]|nr:hypothetical protein [Bifidobacterium breve]KOA67418.1 hypothetical protein BBM1605_03815 [Bifidobacterium breve MCC 1605]